ncbi:MAG TPA: phosphopantetheine-binding protein, partial [Thermoanaerobaculia bacterium]|nr:phosphopantetheine-binding protein [Thermoanaerobaculia bacterium]
LGHEPVGVDDDFFALGGNSLHVMQVLAALREVFQRDVPADLVFLASTIARFLEELFPGEAERTAAERLAEGILGVEALQGVSPPGAGAPQTEV